MGFDRWECETPQDILAAILFEGVERITSNERAKAEELSGQLSEFIGSAPLWAELGNARLAYEIGLVEAAARLGPLIEPSLSERATNGESLDDLLSEVMAAAGYDDGLET